MCRGENEAALAAGQGGSGRPVGVGPGPEFAGGDHAGQACADAGFPALEARGEDGAGLVITFAGLADEVGHGAAAVSAALLLELNDGESPPLQAAQVPSCASGLAARLTIEATVNL